MVEIHTDTIEYAQDEFLISNDNLETLEIPVDQSAELLREESEENFETNREQKSLPDEPTMDIEIGSEDHREMISTLYGGISSDWVQCGISEKNIAYPHSDGKLYFPTDIEKKYPLEKSPGEIEKFIDTDHIVVFIYVEGAAGSVKSYSYAHELPPAEKIEEGPKEETNENKLKEDQETEQTIISLDESFVFKAEIISEIHSENNLFSFFNEDTESQIADAAEAHAETPTMLVEKSLSNNTSIEINNSDDLTHNKPEILHPSSSASDFAKASSDKKATADKLDILRIQNDADVRNTFASTAKDASHVSTDSRRRAPSSSNYAQSGHPAQRDDYHAESGNSDSEQFQREESPTVPLQPEILRSDVLTQKDALKTIPATTEKNQKLLPKQEPFKIPETTHTIPVPPKARSTFERITLLSATLKNKETKTVNPNPRLITADKQRLSITPRNTLPRDYDHLHHPAQSGNSDSEQFQREESLSDNTSIEINNSDDLTHNKPEILHPSSSASDFAKASSDKKATADKLDILRIQNDADVRMHSKRRAPSSIPLRHNLNERDSNYAERGNSDSEQFQREESPTVPLQPEILRSDVLTQNDPSVRSGYKSGERGATSSITEITALRALGKTEAFQSPKPAVQEFRSSKILKQTPYPLVQRVNQNRESLYKMLNESPSSTAEKSLPRTPGNINSNNLVSEHAPKVQSYPASTSMEEDDSTTTPDTYQNAITLAA